MAGSLTAAGADAQNPPMSPRDISRADLLPGRRRALILEQVRRRGAAAIHELAEAVGVSLSTVRRDLDYLTTRGYLARTHGGALIEHAPAATYEPENEVAAHAARAQKTAIGQEAARRVMPGASVMADAGSTVLEAVKALVARQIPLTLVTNSLDAAWLCRNAPAIRTVLTGGTLRPGSTVLTGEPALAFLRGLHADLCLLGAHAVGDGHATETSLEGAEIKKTMLRGARETLLLADSSKFRHPAFCKICDVTELDDIITDDGIDPATLAAVRAQGATVTVVQSGKAKIGQES